MNFAFTKDAKTLFHQLRSAFTSALMLCHLDLSLLIRIETNASRFIISEILL